VNDTTGDNAIIVCPGAASLITVTDIDANAKLLQSAGIFVTQLEQPIDAAFRALEISRLAGVTTILNPAPATDLPAEIFKLCDYVTPNETEASELTGVKVDTLDDARSAADRLLEMGARNAVITLGDKGALLHSAKGSIHIPAVYAGDVVETAGAGDAFNGGFAVALSRGVAQSEAVQFACAVAGISVTRSGTAPSMPTSEEVASILGNENRKT
jgi:ribokinase